MISTFLSAWSLFACAWSAALLLALLLPLCGVVLLLRQQVFLGAAIGQAASLGYAAAIWLGFGAGGDHGHMFGLLAAGLLAAITTAGAALRSLSCRGTEMEVRAAIVFLLGGSGAMVLLADSPHGMHEVQRMFLSSLLGADPWDVALAAALLIATVAAVPRFGQRLALWAVDPVTAAALGLRVGRWDLWVGVWLGTSLAFAIHVAGLVFAFGASVLPVLLAREVCRSLRGVLWTAPLAGAVLAALGLLAAHVLDRPPGQMVVVVQAALLLTVRAARLLGVRMQASQTTT